MTFPADQLFCVLDYETYSECDLKKHGSFEYSLHPTTEILCAAWCIGTRETLRDAEIFTYAPIKGKGTDGWQFQALQAALLDGRHIIAAHNALFEQVITRNVLGRRIANHTLTNLPPSRWLCTAAMAAALALPRRLEHAAQALKLANQKDMAGHRLMQKFTKPRKPTKNNPAIRHTDPEEYQRVVDYCVKDVETEVELFLRCPLLTARERQIWELDQTINLRGFQVDRPLVKTVLGMVAKEIKALNRESLELTNGVLSSATKRNQVMAWLESDGYYLTDLKRKTVEDAIKEGLVDGNAKRLLENRLAISKTSTAKYHAFEKRSRHDGRARDNLIYHAASTGRWGGAGIQPQNLFKSTIGDSIEACEIVAEGDLEMIRLLYGDPMEVFASCCRGMIITPKGKVFDTGDFNAIEARVAFWLADHKEGLRAFREGRDLYKEQASEIYACKIARVDDDQRFVGKQAVLGCIFGVGPPKFKGHCHNLGQEISDDLAKRAVSAFRKTHRPVVQLWSNIEKAAVAAVQNPGTKYTINKTKWWVHGKYLWCLLPSGRRLAYREPSIQYDLTPWGEKRPVLYHWGVDAKTKKWTRQKTWGGVLVENITQATARDVMAEAMLRIEATGVWQIVLSVHDELLGERDKDSLESWEDFRELMEEVPPWAAGLPIKVGGWSGTRYRK